MLVKTVNEFELRGVTRKVSKKGNAYFVGHFEDQESFQPSQFMLGEDCSKLGANPKKGDFYYLTLEYNTRFREMHLVACEKVV